MHTHVPRPAHAHAEARSPTLYLLLLYDVYLTFSGSITCRSNFRRILVFRCTRKFETHASRHEVNQMGAQQSTTDAPSRSPRKDASEKRSAPVPIDNVKTCHVRACWEMESVREASLKHACLRLMCACPLMPPHACRMLEKPSRSFFYSSSRVALVKSLHALKLNRHATPGEPTLYPI